jgi:hypothetical protein
MTELWKNATSSFVLIPVIMKARLLLSNQSRLQLFLDGKIVLQYILRSSKKSHYLFSMNISSNFTFSENAETHSKRRRRVICQARGLSCSHNENTAIIEIPANAPHGLLLICSNSECFSSHRRFRYCKSKFFNQMI